jgi:integrase/recombinase XerC
VRGDLRKILAGLPATWASFLTDWDRTLRSGNYPPTTRYNYLLAAAQLARYLSEHAGGRGSNGAQTPTVVTRQDVEAFQAWMIETRSAPPR